MIEMEEQIEQPLVRLEGVSKNFGNIVAVQPLNLEIQGGDFLKRSCS